MTGNTPHIYNNLNQPFIGEGTGSLEGFLKTENDLEKLKTFSFPSTTLFDFFDLLGLCSLLLFTDLSAGERCFCHDRLGLEYRMLV